MILEDVEFAYGRAKPVLSGFTWTIPAGITVLLGPNGAGKSTCLNLAASVFRPRRGLITDGSLTTVRPSDRRQWRRRVGWVPQQIVAIPGMTTREQVAYAAWLKGFSGSDAQVRAVSALKSVGLEDCLEVKANSLSGGQLRRLGIASSLVHDATILLLDEPTAGLDPAERGRFRRLLRHLRGDHDFVISTHQVDDLDELADTVAVLSAGRIIFHDTVASFLSLGQDEAPRGASLAEIAYRRLIEGVA